jgi:hypothetical protein
MTLISAAFDQLIRLAWVCRLARPLHLHLEHELLTLGATFLHPHLDPDPGPDRDAAARSERWWKEGVVALAYRWRGEAWRPNVDCAKCR